MLNPDETPTPETHPVEVAADQAAEQPAEQTENA